MHWIKDTDELELVTGKIKWKDKDVVLQHECEIVT